MQRYARGCRAAFRCQRADEVALQCGGAGVSDRGGWQRGERLDRDDGARHNESDELGSDEVEAEGLVVGAEVFEPSGPGLPG
jgi:hypothetical protein